MAEGHGFHRHQSLSSLPDAGLDIAIEAKPDERRTLAEFLGVLGVGHLSARLTLQKWRAHGVRVTGIIDAQVTQSCVATLEPVASRLSLDVDRKFLPEAMLERDTDPHEMLIDPDGDDPPDPLPHSLDLADLATEEVLLNLDPYPRKAGADGAVDSVDEAEVKPENPFAVLKSVLKP